MKAYCKLLACSLLYFVLSGTNSYAQQSSELSDPEIASVAVTANQIDIDAAKLAKEKSKDQEILKFAETMINDHQAVIDQAVALVKKLNVTPKDNAVSQKMSADAAKTKKMLQSKSDKDFNRAYIDNEVAYHKVVIEAVQNVLIPHAQNAELKQLLQNIMPALKTHLEHAEMIQKTFNK
jgi:putative membrane protein